MADGQITINQRATEPNAPGVGKIALAYNNVTGRWEGKLPNGDLVLFESLFGSTKVFADRQDDQTTTDGTNWTTYLTTNGNNFPTDGRYVIFLSFFYGYSVDTRDFESRILIDGAQVGEILKLEGKDSGTDQRVPATIMAITTNNLTNSNFQVQHQFKAQQNGDEARMYSSTIGIWRIS